LSHCQCWLLQIGRDATNCRDINASPAPSYGLHSCSAALETSTTISSLSDFWDKRELGIAVHFSAKAGPRVWMWSNAPRRGLFSLRKAKQYFNEAENQLKVSFADLRRASRLWKKEEEEKKNEESLR
jgi:hypothetical protein